MDAKPFKKIPPVGAVMTPFPYFVNADDTVEEVERLMDEHNIRHVPVQDKGRVVGIVSERDLHHRVNRVLPKEDKKLIHARDVMVADPYVTAFDVPLNEVAVQMAKRHIGSAIILHHGKLAGVLSVTDVCRLLAEVLESRFPPGGDDDAA
jgi:acetoin utilization protein AcuB